MKEHIAHMIRERASHFGEREVFRYKDRESKKYIPLSWNELLSQTDKVAEALISLGYGPADNIGIYSNNRLEWMITDLGILSAGAVVVPFFSSAARQQVKYITDETGMKLMFIGGNDQVETALWLLENSSTLEKIVVYEEGLDIKDSRFLQWKDFLSLADGSHKEKALEVLEEAGPDDLATIIYTSGTTGEPKGVMLNHENFMHTFKLHDIRLDIREDDVSMTFLPLSHVFERTWSLYMLHCGAVNTILENPREVMENLKIARPTLMCTVPRFLEKTFEGIEAEVSGWPGWKKSVYNWAIQTGHKYSFFRSKNMAVPSLLSMKMAIADRLVFHKLRAVFGGNIRSMPCSGAAIRPELLRYFHATGLNVVYGYGATETTATVSCFKADTYDFNTVGTILDGVDVRIGDEGEIQVKGKTVFQGYYRKPEETAAVLKDGWYGTGDEGSIGSEGRLVMSDRIKDLFKTSLGKYISPQKVELLLAQDRYIEQVIVIGDNRKYVTALIVPVVEQLKAYADKLGLGNLQQDLLLSRQEIIDHMKERIDKLQTELTAYEKVVKFTLLKEPFSIENMTMTSTLKLRRRIIMDHYREIIEKMYLQV